MTKLMPIDENLYEALPKIDIKMHTKRNKPQKFSPPNIVHKQHIHSELDTRRVHDKMVQLTAMADHDSTLCLKFGPEDEVPSLVHGVQKSNARCIGERILHHAILLEKPLCWICGISWVILDFLLIHRTKAF